MSGTAGNDRDLLSLRLARYGVPAVIMVFYLSASRQFDYTPESTYVALAQIIGLPAEGQSGYTSPLWSVFLMGFQKAGIDPLLGAKVLSLLFAAAAVLTAFLIGVEILRDRFLAFAATLMFAVQSWFTQAAVSGHPFAFGMALVLGGVFFLQRNEYPLGAVLIGLCTLVFWQAMFLLPVLASDAVFNSTEKHVGVSRAVRAASATVGVVALWVVIASTAGNAIIPTMPSFREFTTPHPAALLPVLISASAGTAGLVILLNGGEEGRRIFLALVPPVGVIVALGASSLSANPELWRIGLPLIFGTGLLGGRLILEKAGRGQLVYLLALLLAGLTLIQSQVETYGVTRDLMTRARLENQELAAIAVWIRAHADPDREVCSERPAILAYYAGLPVRAQRAGRDSTVLFVGVRPPGPHSSPVYRLPSPPDALEIPGIGYAVWRME